MKLLASACSVLLLASAISAATLPQPVEGFPIGRCVKIAGVSAPEDAKTAGFEYMEVALQDVLSMPDNEFNLTVNRLKAIGLPALSGYGFMPGDLKVVGPDVNTAEVSKHIKRGLDRASRLGLKFVVFGNLNNKSRQYPEGFSHEHARQQLMAFAKEAAVEARKRGITVLLEPLPANQTNLINTVPEALSFMREIDDANLRLLVDYAYLTNGKEDISVLQTAARYIGQVEVSNPNGRVYPRESSESDYLPFFRALRQGGYQGGFSVHGKPADFFVDAPRAIALLRTLVVEAAPIRNSDTGISQHPFLYAGEWDTRKPRMDAHLGNHLRGSTPSFQPVWARVAANLFSTALCPLRHMGS